MVYLAKVSRRRTRITRLGRGPDLARDAVGQPSWQGAAPRASGRSRAARALRAWRSRIRSVGQAAPGRGRHGRRRDAAGDEQARAAYDPARRRPEGTDLEAPPSASAGPRRRGVAAARLLGPRAPRGATGAAGLAERPLSARAGGRPARRRPYERAKALFDARRENTQQSGLGACAHLLGPSCWSAGARAPGG